MKKNKLTQTLGGLVFGAALVCLAPASQAISVNFGTPYEGNSWLQPVNVIGAIESFTASIVPGSDTGAGPFEAPGAFDFVVDGGFGFDTFSVTSFDPQALAVDSDFGFGSTGSLDFTLAFVGDIFQDVTVDLEFFDNLGTSYGVFQLVHVGSTDAPVPDGGATFYLLGLSLMGMVWLRRKAA